MVTMTRRVLLLLSALSICLALTGCGGSSPFAGEWETDIEATKASFHAAMQKQVERMKESEDESERMAAGMMQSMLGSMVDQMSESMRATMSINADGTYRVVDARDTTTEGTWSEQGGQIVMLEGEEERARGSIEGGKLVMLPNISEADAEGFPVEDLRLVFTKAE